MTQTQERPITQTPARRRALPIAPVLIRVPALAGAPRPTGAKGRVRRRRLRREVRVVGFLLLAIVPISMAYATIGRNRLTPMVAASSLRETIEETTASEVPAILLSISPEPVASAPPPNPGVGRDHEPPVRLSTRLLPVESPEETRDGGH